MARKSKYSAAIIGCGKIGCYLDKYKPGFVSTHLSAYKKNRRIRLVAVCDADLSKAKEIAKENGIGQVFSNVADLMRCARPDLVSICTPDSTHYSVLKEVARCDSVKGIWCEKPIAVNMQQAEEMVKICRKRGIKLVVNHIRRYDPFYAQVKKSIDKNVGEISSVVCYYSGGIVTVGSHIIDLLDFFLGRCISVSACNASSGGVMSGVLNYRRGVHAYLVPCRLDRFSIMELDILGSKGRLDIMNKPFGRYDYRYSSAEVDSKVGMKFVAAESKDLFRRDIRRVFFENALADIISCIDDGKNPISSGDVGSRSLEIISALTYSAANGSMVVKLPFKKKHVCIPAAQGDVRKWKS